MKITLQKNKKIPLIILVILIPLLLLGFLAALELTRTTDFVKNPFYQPSAEELEQQRIDESNKADETGGSKEDIKTNPNVDTTKNTSEVPIDSGGEISIDTISQLDGQITFTTSVSENLADNGTCTVTFSNSEARPVSRTVTAKNHICGPQTIPETEFTVIGTWQVTARYFSDNAQVVSSKTVEIK